MICLFELGLDKNDLRGDQIVHPFEDGKAFWREGCSVSDHFWTSANRQMCEKHSIIEFYRNSHWFVSKTSQVLFTIEMTKCYRRCERDFAEWEIHKGSWKDMKSLTLNRGRWVWSLHFIMSELGIVDCFQFHIPLFPLSSNILFVGSLLDWVNITMCVSHLLPWVLSGQSLYEIMQRFFLLLLSGQSLYKIILRFFLRSCTRRTLLIIQISFYQSRVFWDLCNIC